MFIFYKQAIHLHWVHLPPILLHSALPSETAHTSISFYSTFRESPYFYIKLLFLQRQIILLHNFIHPLGTTHTSTLCYSSSRDTPYSYITFLFSERQPLLLHYVILPPETIHTSTLRTYSIRDSPYFYIMLFLLQRQPILLHYARILSDTPYFYIMLFFVQRHPILLHDVILSSETAHSSTSWVCCLLACWTLKAETAARAPTSSRMARTTTSRTTSSGMRTEMDASAPNWMTSVSTPGVSYGHYSDIIMSAMASQITGVSIVCHGAFVRGINEGTEGFPYQGASNADNVSIWWRHHLLLSGLFDTLASGRSGCDFKNAIFKLVLLTGIFRYFHDNALR